MNLNDIFDALNNFTDEQREAKYEHIAQQMGYTVEQVKEAYKKRQENKKRSKLQFSPHRQSPLSGNWNAHPSGRFWCKRHNR